jgi:hypothetical protein
MQDALIRPTFIGKLFGSIRIVELSLEGISIVYKRKAQTFLSYSDLIDVPSFESGFFGGVITLKTPDNIVRLTLLNQEGSDGPYTNLKSSAIQSLAKRITIAVG